MKLLYFACAILLLQDAFADDSIISKIVSKRSVPQNSNDFPGRRKASFEIEGVIEEANCEPENRSTSLLDSDYNPTYHYNPRYALVEKCGGCCNNELKTCQNISSAPLDFQVDVYVPNKVDGEVTYVKSHTKVVTKYQHVKCECGCKIKQQDCKLNQIYNENTCQCVCANEEAKDLCKASNQIWDSLSCECM